MRVKKVLLLSLFFFSLLSLSGSFTQGVRSVAVFAFSPLWGLAQNAGEGAEHSSADEIAVENELLRAQVETLKEWVISESRREEELTRLLCLCGLVEKQESKSPLYKRRSEELARLIEMQMRALPAHVIFRDPLSWSSSLWLGVGSDANRALGAEIVAVDSPVVVGSALVGVVEQVERKRCRVRLITDSGLTPSVRALRGEEQSRVLKDHLLSLKTALELQKELSSLNQDQEALLHLLEKNALTPPQEVETAYLAKGELHGSSAPLWRSRGQLLRGVGFNYDFEDSEGAARILRTGASIDGTRAPTPLLRQGDLLVTTGFDGVFPAGLHVAYVTRIARLREGASSYEIEAKPVVENLDRLHTVFILPPLEKKP